MGLRLASSNKIIKGISVLCPLVGIFLLFSGVDFGLAITIASIVLLVICYPVAKKAKLEIAKVDPDILTKQKAVETAEGKKDAAESLHKTSQAVKDYESKKDSKP